MARKPIISTRQVWIRVALLVVGFFAVISSIKGIKNNKTLDAFFAPQAGQQITSSTLNLCPTRVERIDVVDGRNNKRLSFYQKNSKWLAEGSQTFELEPLFMEKWLAEFCEVKIDKFVEVPEGTTLALAATQEIKFTYVDGSHQEVRAHGGEFTTAKGLVVSDELTRAVLKLNP